VFLKTAERIDALMMVMTLCLAIYGLLEYELQQSMAAKGETIPSQTQKPTAKPSLRWVFFLFRVVNVLIINANKQQRMVVVNIDPVLRQLLKHFGPRALAIYLNPAGLTIVDPPSRQ
jgi:transposase